MRGTQIDGAVVLVTGAASGIGRALALTAASRGARVVLTDLMEEPLAAVAQEIADAGGTVLVAEALDLTDDDAVRAFAASVHQQVDAVDVMANVAGISTWGRLQDLRTEHWRRVLEVDLMAPIHVLSAFVPPMIERGTGGHVVNVSSAAGLFGLPLHAPYSAAKFGLRGVSEVLRFDLERDDIGVTLVCPGAVDTPLVGTIDIVGVDRDDPSVRAAVERFRRHAVGPEVAAERILRGVERGRPLVFTSRDIRTLALVQRFAPPLYATVMRRLNRRAHHLVERTRP